MINFRQATLADLPTIVAIYNQTIAPHAVTADMEPVTVEQRRGWFNSFSDDHPLWVVEDGGQVIGWVWSPFMDGPPTATPPRWQFTLTRPFATRG